MVNYECKRCGYTTKHRSFINHLERKNICVPLLEDISIEEVKNYYNLKIQSKMNQNESKMNPIESKMNPMNLVNPK